MKTSNNILIGIAFILLGLLALLQNSGIIFLNFKSVSGVLLIIFGVSSVYQSFSQGERKRLFIYSILFFVGVIFLVDSHFEFLNRRGLVFSSILFISGSSLFILFIDNTKEKVFLYSAIILMFLGYASTNLLKDITLIVFANRISTAVETFGPFILLLLGLNLFLNRKK